MGDSYAPLCCYFCVVSAPGSQETYMLYKDVCAIPTTVTRRVELVNVSRAVCRFACSETYEAECSGFLFSRRERRCTLSPYTGELRPNGTVVCDLTSGLEFYRRTRLLSRLLHFVCSVKLPCSFIAEQKSLITPSDFNKKLSYR